MTQIREAKKADDNRIYAFCECDSCGYPNVILADRVNNQTGSLTSNEEAFTRYSKYSKNESWLPEKSKWKEYEDVPNNIASAASEAYACFSINANRAAVLLARTTVQAIAKDKGIHTNNLYGDIEKMADDNIITSQLKDEAHEIRFLGNDMAHGDLGTPVDENDASDILGFLDTLLDYVYQQPIAIQKRRELREQRRKTQPQNY
ncbi:MAG: DUF4145 domain-containing protein [Bifidobacterium sp.]|uniref:DUF4145 domain-containing protein n=1 Tax=Bifidobacterium fermentum TaxID=3059035 RepID=A0AB39UH98_9BIFI